MVNLYEIPEIRQLERLVMYAPTNSEAGKRARDFFARLNASYMEASQVKISDKNKEEKK